MKPRHAEQLTHNFVGHLSIKIQFQLWKLLVNEGVNQQPGLLPRSLIDSPTIRRLIARLPDSAAKAGEYTTIDCTREAAEVAAKLRDADLFTSIQNAVSANSPAGLAIAQIRERAMATFR